MLLLAPVGRAQEGEPEATPTPPPARLLRLEDRRQELAQLRRRIQVLRARYEEARRREKDLKEAIAVADLNLEIRTAERRMLELQEADAEKAAQEAGSLRDTSAREVASLQQDLALRVSTLYRLGRLGYLRTLVAVESGRTFLRGLKVLSHMARRDATLLRTYEASLRNLHVRERELVERKTELRTLAAESRRKETELVEARAEKARLLTQTTRTAEDVQRTVQTLEDRSSRLASLLDLLETRGRALPAGAASIRRFKGVLDWPAKGKVVVPFGRIANPKFKGTFLRSSGWTIDVPTGTETHAVFAGDVVYAQWMKGYGNLVVLDHGEGVFSVYGRLANGTVSRGERVGVGERVGQLGDSPEEEVAGLYFEIREARASVDPKDWLK